MATKKVVKSSTIGIEGFVIFPFDKESMEYGKPIELETLKEVKITVNVAEHDEHNDNGLFETITRFSNAEISCEFTDLTPREQGIILGWKRDGAVQLLTNHDVAGTFAIAYKRTKADGNNKFVKFLSCSAKLEGVDAKTESESIETQPDRIVFKAKPLSKSFPIAKYRDVVKMEVDTADEQYKDEGDDWFTSAIPTSDLPESQTKQIKKGAK